MKRHRMKQQLNLLQVQRPPHTSPTSSASTLSTPRTGCGPIANANGRQSVARSRLVEALIPVLDEVRLAQENGDVSGAFETHVTKLVDSLTKVGVEQYGEVGDEFDPRLHEALMQQPSDDVETPTIFLVMQPGYRLGDRESSVRPASACSSRKTENSNLAEVVPRAQRHLIDAVNAVTTSAVVRIFRDRDPGVADCEEKIEYIDEEDTEGGAR